MKVAVSFGARALVGSHDGLDVPSVAARYAELVRDALAREWPDAELEVTWSDDRASTRAVVSDVDDVRAREVERGALDLAWVVRQMGAWSA